MTAGPLVQASDQGTSSGTVLSYTQTKSWKNGAATPVYGSSADTAAPDSHVHSHYDWGDGPVLRKAELYNDHGSSTSTYTRDAAGRLWKVNVEGGSRPHGIAYTVDAAGRVLERLDTSQNGGSGPRERYYRFDGIEMGTVGNDGTGNVGYAQAIADRTAVPGSGAFRGGMASGTAFADFDQSFVSINPASQTAGQTAGGSWYTVRQGDTLAGIAQGVWGDASLWYLIAEANPGAGAGANTALVAGMGLIIPQAGPGRTSLRNDATTFRPYDPASAMGDVHPGAPKPPARRKGCGGLGAILLAVVAIAVTALALPSGVPTFTQGLLAGAAGSAASQTVGLATGLQSKFDFKGLALSAIAGGVTAGLGDPGVVGKSAARFMSADKVFNAAVRGLVGNAVTQGIGVATGLQDRFSWAGVAAAGAGAAAANAIRLPGDLGRAASQAAGGIAASAAQSLVTGKSFGDTLISNLPGIIGNTIGSLVADAVAGRPARASGAGNGHASDGSLDTIVNRDLIYDTNIGSSGGLSLDTPQLRAIRSFAAAARMQDEFRAVAQLSTGTLASIIDVPSYGGVTGGPAIGNEEAKWFLANSSGDLDGFFAQKEYRFFGENGQDWARYGAYADRLIATGNLTQLQTIVSITDGLSVNPQTGKGWGIVRDSVQGRLDYLRAAGDREASELLRAGLFAADLGVGGYNIATGNGGLRDYLAVGSVVPFGKMLGVVGVAARTEIKGFASYSALKRYLGSPGAGNQWHHIVEQTKGNVKAFGAEMIHSTDNVVAIPASIHIGKGSISAYYSSIQPGTNSLTVRQWLSTQSFQAQRQYGLDILKKFGQ